MFGRIFWIFFRNMFETGIPQYHVCCKVNCSMSHALFRTGPWYPPCLTLLWTIVNRFKSLTVDIHKRYGKKTQAHPEMHPRYRYIYIYHFTYYMDVDGLIYTSPISPDTLVNQVTCVLTCFAPFSNTFKAADRWRTSFVSWRACSTIVFSLEFLFEWLCCSFVLTPLEHYTLWILNSSCPIVHTLWLHVYLFTWMFGYKEKLRYQLICLYLHKCTWLVLIHRSIHPWCLQWVAQYSVIRGKFEYRKLAEYLFLSSREEDSV